MEIDRETLIKLLEACAGASEVLQRDLFLYQGLFFMACKANGMNDDEIQKTLGAGRESLSHKIDEACRDTHRDLLGRLPRIVDLLASDQDAALRSLKEWTPKGLLG
jgi:hypothetical protein